MRPGNIDRRKRVFVPGPRYFLCLLSRGSERFLVDWLRICQFLAEIRGTVEMLAGHLINLVLADRYFCYLDGKLLQLFGRSI